ncbi:hypothetical protein PTI98_001637 [Pleurotus ostreatus]|nr:hypothetical protein PTI98_001637 [Pleurotus ostreatus]
MAPLSSHILDTDDKSQVKHLVSSASTVLNQPPPPTLREILGAYNSRGDGDRDMLLAMLNAKTAEDQRLASVASLHRTMLEVCSTAASEQLPPPHNFYPTPNFTNSPLSMTRNHTCHLHNEAARPIPRPGILFVTCLITTRIRLPGNAIDCHHPAHLPTTIRTLRLMIRSYYLNHPIIRNPRTACRHHPTPPLAATLQSTPPAHVPLWPSAPYYLLVGLAGNTPATIPR